MTKFSDEIQEHLIDFKEKKQYLPPMHPQKRWEYLEITDNLFPPARHGFLQYAYDKGLAFHDYARHVRSSQIFGFNLIYPLIINGKLPQAIEKFTGTTVQKITSWHFEYIPEDNYLGEWNNPNSETPQIDYVTAVDFVVLTVDKQSKRNAVLLEVKFTESSFSKCGGYESNGNKNRAFCRNFDEKSFKDNCYLVKPKERKYFELTDGFYHLSEFGRCPFQQNNQCQRNHALAEALRIHDIVDESYFGLVYHDRNVTIKEKWDRYKSMCVETERNKLFEIKAGELASMNDDETYRTYLEDRYQIPLS